jgi:DNA-binding beta-propeller fold protein YncE
VLRTALPALVLGCTLNHPGDDPEPGKIYYPVAVALSAGEPPKYLYVVNSNFDLAYNAGTVQVYDLDRLKTKTDECQSEIDCRIDTLEVRVEDGEDDDGEVWIGSYAGGIARSIDGTRLYIPTRSDTGLTYIDVDRESGRLECGQGSDRRCNDDHVRGEDSAESANEVKLPGEPVGLVTGSISDLSKDGDGPKEASYVLVAHREGAVSLFLDDGDRPRLVDVARGFSQRTTGIGIAPKIGSDPATGIAYITSVDYSTGVQSKSLDRVAVEFDGDQSYIVDMGRLYLDGISAERDTRAVAFNSDEYPGKAFVVARTPSALLSVDLGLERTNPRVVLATAVTEVGAGASRLAIGRIGDDERRFAFVSCYGSRELFVIDLDLEEPVSVIRGFSGPFEMAVDEGRNRIYVADFRSSVIRVVDLEPVLSGGREARIVATLGIPRPPEELL